MSTIGNREPTMPLDTHDEANIVVDVLIIGAGPTGLTLANLLGKRGLKVAVLERNEKLIDYPRGVSLDDESLRVFQTIELADDIVTVTIPDQWIRYITATGRCFATVEPRKREFGWPRRNAFIQPLADKILFEGLARFPQVSVRFGCELMAFEQRADGVISSVAAHGEVSLKIRSDFIVGCDGGRSRVRKLLDIAFEGKTDSTRWVVIDVSNDPLGIPDAYLFCDPKRPRVSMALPNAVRRFEFMVFEHESEQDVLSETGIKKLLSLVLSNPEVEIIRARIYTHHARLAKTFVKSRALLAGDAAHLMPVWQGQGFNSGIRDASNIAWKIAAIKEGMSNIDLLLTYDSERRPHAAAMISLSVMVGRIFSPTNRVVARFRDIMTFSLSAFPAVKAYLLQMKFKPMPFYRDGAVIHASGLARMKARFAVGRMFPQPWIIDSQGETRRLDDVLGDWFSIISYALDPRQYMSVETRVYWEKLGARFVCIAPSSQRETLRRLYGGDNLLIITDRDQDMKQWFGLHQVATVVVRPDRFVAAAGEAAEIDSLSRRFKALISGHHEMAEQPPKVGQVPEVAELGNS